MLLNNGRIIELDDNNEKRALCCICIAPLSAGLMKSSIDDRVATMLLPIETHKAAMLAIHPPTGRMQYLGLCNCDWVTPQGRERKRRSVVTHVKVTNQKKQQKSKSTGDANSPVTLLTETTIPQHSRNTRSSGAKRVDANVNVAQETMMPAVLVCTADDNDDFESPDNDISRPTEIGPVNSATVEVTVDDVNAEVNSKLRAIEAMDLMKHGDGGESDKLGFELDFHNDAVRPRVTLCAAKSNGVSEGAVSDDDLDNHCYFDSPCHHRWNKTEQHGNLVK
jgi:hypothetical protein